MTCWWNWIEGGELANSGRHRNRHLRQCPPGCGNLLRDCPGPGGHRQGAGPSCFRPGGRGRLAERGRGEGADGADAGGDAGGSPINTSPTLALPFKKRRWIHPRRDLCCAGSSGCRRVSEDDARTVKVGPAERAPGAGAVGSEGSPARGVDGTIQSVFYKFFGVKPGRGKGSVDILSKGRRTRWPDEEGWIYCPISRQACPVEEYRGGRKWQRRRGPPSGVHAHGSSVTKVRSGVPR